MKKLLLSAAWLLSIGLYAQVGINTSDPKASLDVSYNGSWAETKPQGVSFPNVTTAQRSKFENTPVGTMIYNTDNNCVEIYLGGTTWNCVNSSQNPSSNVVISSIDFEGEYVAGVGLNNSNKVKVTLQNNGLYEVKNINFSDALTFQNPGSGSVSVQGTQNSSVSLTGGQSVVLTYTLTGTPAKGKLVATFNKLGLNKSEPRNVGLGSATIADNIEDYIVSFFYTESGANVDIPGYLPNEYEIKIPYASGAKGSYDGFTTQEIVTAQGENGTKTVKLFVDGGTFDSNGGFIKAKVLVTDGSTYNVKKETVPGHSTLIVTFADLEIGGSKFNVELKGVGGIPDKKFNEGRKYIYIPFEGPGGKIWLNQNLGAEYAKVGNGFSTRIGGTNRLDSKAYGDLYQWQRGPDGHQLLTSSTTTTQASSWTPNHGDFIIGSYNWNSNSTWDSDDENNKLWRNQTENNPCPIGYRVPTKLEWETLMSEEPISLLGLTAAGRRSHLDSHEYEGRDGFYWSSTNAYNDSGWVFLFSDTKKTRMTTEYAARGLSVRCLRDK